MAAKKRKRNPGSRGGVNKESEALKRHLADLRFARWDRAIGACKKVGVHGAWATAAVLIAKELSGKSTHVFVDGAFRWAQENSLADVVWAGVALFAVGWAVRERRLRMRSVEKLGQHAANLEKRLDSNRSSSELVLEASG